MSFEEYSKKLAEHLSPKRYAHSMQVVETALEMARQLKGQNRLKGNGVNLDLEKLRLTALFHDYAKDMPGQELIEIAEQHGLISSEVEKRQPDLLHGPVGAFLCRREFGVEVVDDEIYHAIQYHTTGCEGISLLDKIIFLADLIEPGRSYQGVDELRRICEDNLDAGLLYAFDCTLQYVIARKLLIHPLTIRARNRHLLAMDEGLEES